jgi:hypothetical protein
MTMTSAWRGLERRVHATRRREERQPPDTASCGHNRCFAVHRPAVVKLGRERERVGRRGDDPASSPDDASSDLDRSREVAGDVGQRGEHEIAERVSIETVPSLEAKLEERREQCVVFSQRHETIADVTRRDDAEVAPQSPGASAIVCRRDDPHEPINGSAGGVRAPRRAADRAAEHVRQAGAAAKRRNA